MKILSLLAFLCLIGYVSHGQNIHCLGLTYDQVIDYHSNTGGVKTPQTKQTENGGIFLSYDCTDDREIELVLFAYTFNKGKCTMISECYKTKSLSGFIKILNKYNQYDGDNVWFDNANSLIINLDDKMKDTGDFFVYYRPKYIETKK